MSQFKKYNGAYRLSLVNNKEEIVQYNFFIKAKEHISQYTLQQSNSLGKIITHSGSYHVNVKKDDSGSNPFGIPEENVLQTIWVKPNQILSLEVLSAEKNELIKVIIQKASDPYQLSDYTFCMYVNNRRKEKRSLSKEQLSEMLKYLDCHINIGGYELLLGNAFSA